MAQVLIRNVEPSVLERLRTRAQQSGRSLEAELRQILSEAAFDHDKAYRKVAQVRALFAGQNFSDSVELLREDRER